MPVFVDKPAILAALGELDAGKVSFVDRQTGKVILFTLADKAGLEKMGKALKAEPHRFTQVPKPDPRENHAEAEKFIAAVTDLKLKELLKRAMISHAPFREFRDLLHTKPKEKREWEIYHKKTLETRLATFLKSSGLG